MWPILVVVFLLIHISDGLSLDFVSWRSPRVILTDVSVSYPVSFWRQLTSSVPRREYALQEIQLLTLESGVLYLVTGDSSAGKSTLLRLIQGVESPTNGSVERLVVTSSSQDDGPEFSRSQASPIYLDNTKPAYSQDDYIRDIWDSPHDVDNRLTAANQWEAYRNVLSVVFEISCDAQVCDLTTSQLYLCQLGQACLQNCVPSDQDSNIATKDVCLEAPIILLDEWLDKETSQVIHNVQQALQVFIEHTGAIAICVTHKPERFLLSSQSSSSPYYYGDLCRIVMGQGNIRSIRRGDQ